MTIINTEKDELQIILASNSPVEDKEFYMQALAASVRWYSNVEQGDIRTTNDEDAINLSTISKLLTCIISTECSKKEEKLQINIGNADKTMLANALLATVRWFGCAPRLKRFEDNEDGQYLIDITELLNAIIETPEN